MAFFRHSRASNSKVNSLIWPEFELWDFMAVLITCKFDKDPIRNEIAIPWTTFSPLCVYGENFCRSRANNSLSDSPICPEIKLVQDFMADLVTCKFDKDLIKNEIAIIQTTFSPIISQWELLVAMETSFDRLWPKSPMMMHMKFEQDWPTCLRDIQVWKCGCTVDHWY